MREIVLVTDHRTVIHSRRRLVFFFFHRLPGFMNPIMWGERTIPTFPPKRMSLDVSYGSSQWVGWNHITPKSTNYLIPRPKSYFFPHSHLDDSGSVNSNHVSSELVLEPNPLICLHRKLINTHIHTHTHTHTHTHPHTHTHTHVIEEIESGSRENLELDTTSCFPQFIVFFWSSYVF